MHPWCKNETERQWYIKIIEKMGCAIYFHYGNMMIYVAETDTDVLGEIATILRKSMILQCIHIKKNVWLFDCFLYIWT